MTIWEHYLLYIVANKIKSISFLFQMNSINRYQSVSVICLLVAVASCSSYNLACDPRSAQRTCLIGCLRCYVSYGPHLYDMEACCIDCRITGAPILDDGPDICSDKYIQESWLRRYG